ncbi:MAG: hypothetical protein ACQEP7_06720, partial [bacterium]
MQKNMTIMYSLLAVVVVAAGGLLVSIYATDGAGTAPEYLSFYPSDPLVRFEGRKVDELPAAIKTLEIFEKSREVGLEKKVKDKLKKLMENKDVVSSLKNKLKNITDYTTGEFAAGLLQNESNALQFLAVFPLVEKVEISEKKLRQDEELLPDFIRQRWLEKANENLIYETSKAEDVEIHTFRTEDMPEALKFSIARMDKYLLMGVGKQTLPEAVDRRNSSPTLSSLLDEKKNLQIAMAFDHEFFPALVSQVEKHSGDMLEGKVSFSGLREALRDLFSGLQPARARLGFKNENLVVNTELDYELKKVHSFFKYFLELEPVDFQSARFFDKNTVSLIFQNLPRPGEFYRRLTDTLVELINAASAEEVKGQVDQSVSFFRMFLPEKEIIDLLNSMEGEIAVGTVLSPGNSSENLTPEDLAGNTVVVVELDDYGEFVSRLEKFNTYDVFEFNREERRLQFGGGEIELFLDNQEDWLIVGDKQEAVARVAAGPGAGNELQNYQPYRRARKEYPTRLNEFGYYNLEPYAELLEDASLAEEMPGALQEFYAEFKPELVQLLVELSPATFSTVNEPSAGRNRSNLKSPGGTMFSLAMLNALPDIAESRGEIMDAVEESEVAEAQSEISVVRTAFVQCSMDEECNVDRLDESWSDYLSEEHWSDDVPPEWEIYVE